MKKILINILIIVASTISLIANNDSNPVIKGSVKCNNEPLAFVSVWIHGTTIGTATDKDGNFSFSDIPCGTYIVKTQAVGYKMGEKKVTVKKCKCATIDFILDEDTIGLDQVVVTADRNERSRKNAPIVVSTLSPQLLVTTQANMVSEGLNFCPGLRMENDCQNCGFSQLRMNGMEGAYSQILVNSRPIFSGLAGVYGLEMIPSNMLERIEVTRGGGSALFGGNAIAGTVNLITKDPINNSYELGLSNNITGVGMDGTGGVSNDYNVNFNTSIVSESNKSGMSIFGFYRNKEAFDANNDGYSDISEIVNTTVGARVFHRINIKSKIVGDFYTISEKRRGGDQLDKIEHEANIAESVKNNIITGSLNYEYFLSEQSHFSAYASGQAVDRDSYYGAMQLDPAHIPFSSMDAYGNTTDFTYNTGMQYKGSFNNSKLVAGIELSGGILEDTKLGYYDKDKNIHTPNSTIADQETYTIGSFAQYEYQMNRLKASVGVRYDRYDITDNLNSTGNATGNVFSPRVNLLYDVAPNLQARVSYSQGYRAPQIFDEDLHIEVSGARRITHENDPDLKQETSYSYTASIDYTKEEDSYKAQFLAEGFYTHLDNPFVNEIGEQDENGNVVYTRKNAEDGAKVYGVNLEFNLALTDFTFKSGYTIQRSEYEVAQDYNETRFLRTPDNYGFFSIDYKISKSFGVSATGNFTGKMLLPYHGPNLENFENISDIVRYGEGSINEFRNLSTDERMEAGIVRKSETFFDLGLKAYYDIKMKESTIQLYTGVKNIFNSYQSDFDRGINRDPGYIYGPMNPRVVYFGIKIGNIL